MLKRRAAALILLLALLVGSVSATGYTPPPYAILVNRAMNTVTVYAPGNDGYYSVPVKAMICSTAREGAVTPLGRYTMISWRSEWRLMFDGSYGQYATGFYGNYLFHSICYTKPSHDAMKQEAYNALGSPASMGCIRLQTADAKWIYDNCPAGTPVVIYDDPTSPGPLGKPEKKVAHITDELFNGWDPTDPAEGNPWNTMLPTVLAAKSETVTMTAGEGKSLFSVEPASAKITWTSSDEKVATVDETGKVVALAAGKAEICATALDGSTASCSVTVEGELLPFDDIAPGAWYYSELRQALQDDLFHGTGERKFDPDGGMTRAMVVQVLYNLAGQPDVSDLLMEEVQILNGEDDITTELQPVHYFDDVAEDAWYFNAVVWAFNEGVVNGVSETEFAPDRNITRQELVALLWRRAGKPAPVPPVKVYADSAQIHAYAADAYAWAAQQALVWDTEGRLMPGMVSPRAETALIFSRALRGGWLKSGGN